MQDSYLKRGNGAFLEHHYISALNFYQKAITEKPFLENTLAYNTQWIRNRFDRTPSILVVFHVFHEDIVADCVGRIRNIPFPHDVLITTPHHERHPAVVKAKTFIPEARVLFCENRGRDIAPFIRSWHQIQKYDLCCKVHTKKGDPDYAVAWKELLLDGVLGTPREIEAIVDAFHTDPNVAIAGNELLYAPHPLFIGRNGANIDQICVKHSIKTYSHDHDGFFMGSMFWIRPSSFSFIEKLANLEFEDERGEIDGQLEHALERILGSMTLSEEKKILLVWHNRDYIPYSQKVAPNHRTRMLSFKQYFGAIASARKEGQKIRGDIHIHSTNDPAASILTGWLAVCGDARPREARILIDDRYHIDVMCHMHRKDLVAHYINEGNHGFHLNIPREFLDSVEHEYKLYDKATGTFIKKISCVKSIADSTGRLDRVSAF